MATPEEINRAFYQWFSSVIGRQHVFTIDFDADFVAGNTIDGSFAGDAIDPVLFDTDQETTLGNLAVEIQGLASVFLAEATGSRQITVTGAQNGQEIALIGPTVSGGASQAITTIAEFQAPQEIQVILADQASPRPEKPYGVIRLGVEQRLGLRDPAGPVDDLGMVEYTGQRMMMVALDLFGPGAVGQMHQARSSLSRQSSLDHFYNGFGISILDDGNIANLTDFLEVTSEERAMMEVKIGYSVSTREEIGWIETVEANDQIISIDN